MRNVPSGEERSETDVFAGYTIIFLFVLLVVVNLLNFRISLFLVSYFFFTVFASLFAALLL